MLSSVAGGAELEPPVRVPHTVYVGSLNRIGGSSAGRHHIIKAAPALARGVSSDERDRPYQH